MAVKIVGKNMDDLFEIYKAIQEIPEEHKNDPFMKVVQIAFGGGVALTFDLFLHDMSKEEAVEHQKKVFDLAKLYAKMETTDRIEDVLSILEEVIKALDSEKAGGDR